jgi:HdeA/HdeB family protein
MNRRGVLGWAALASVLAFTPAQAEDQPKKVDIKNLSCESFLALPDDVRPVVVAWVHGYTRAGGENWVFQAGEGKAFIASVEDKCKKAPKASFRYQVLHTAQEREAAAKAAKK